MGKNNVEDDRMKWKNASMLIIHDNQKSNPSIIKLKKRRGYNYIAAIIF